MAEGAWGRAVAAHTFLLFAHKLNKQPVKAAPQPSSHILSAATLGCIWGETKRLSFQLRDMPKMYVLISHIPPGCFCRLLAPISLPFFTVSVECHIRQTKNQSANLNFQIVCRRHYCSVCKHNCVSNQTWWRTNLVKRNYPCICLRQSSLFFSTKTLRWTLRDLRDCIIRKLWFFIQPANQNLSWQKNTICLQKIQCYCCI